jgi:hypothetical protein
MLMTNTTIRTSKNALPSYDSQYKKTALNPIFLGFALAVYTERA